VAFSNMWNEILGAIPGMNTGLAKTKINEAFEAIQNENIFSFQLKTGGWLAPGQLGGPNSSFLSPGTISVQPYTDIIIGDAVANAAWAAANQPFITQYQIRVPYYSLYNIIAYQSIPYPSAFVLTDTVTGQLYSFSVASGAFQFIPVTFGNVIANPVFYDAGLGVYWQLQVTNGALVSFETTSANAIDQYLVADTVTNLTRAFQFYYGSFENIPTNVGPLGQLTLDRLWMEPAAPPGTNYLAYQAYFASPPGFKEWHYIVDTVNNNYMDWWSLNAIDLSEQDPQRTLFSQPEYVVPWGIDSRQNSSTAGQFLWELWEGPVGSPLPYNFGCKCNWPALVGASDTLPFPLTEEVVKLRALAMSALWKESSKGDDMERGSGANWQFLSQAYNKEYANRLKLCKNMDRNIVDLYFTRMRRRPQNQEPYASVGGQMSVGS
jgi:hypothetical protein